MRLKNYINELSVKTNVDVDVVKNDDWRFTTEWTSDGVKYYMSGIRTTHREPEEYLSNLITWEVVFMKYDPDQEADFTSKHAVDVFSHVVKSIILFAKLRKPEMFFFHGATIRLEKLYKRFVPKLAKMLPQYRYQYAKLRPPEMKQHLFIRKIKK